MKQSKIYEATDKMIDLIRDNYNTLQSLSSFGIRLGFGDKTVEQVCRSHKVDTTTFLAVVNLSINGTSSFDIANLSVATLLHYLEACHRYYIDYQLPSVRKELAESIEGNSDDEIGRLILKVYDEYAQEIRRHMRYEERMLFPYVERLMKGETSTNYSIDDFVRKHAETDKNLKELKQMIIKYLPSNENSNALIGALYHIYNNEEWLESHQEVENLLFVPLIRLKENELKSQRITSAISAFANAEPTENSETISEREKEVIVAVVQGMSNKEIADHLFISPNTVTTHRKNIARKLQIHSPAGLTIYAIVNGLVDIGKLKSL